MTEPAVNGEGDSMHLLPRISWGSFKDDVYSGIDGLWSRLKGCGMGISSLKALLLLLSNQ